MCPPAISPLPDISEHCSGEELVMLLEKFVRGDPLPRNVTDDVNPHHHNPEHLPAGLWYFIVLQNHRAIEHGAWKAIEGPRGIFSNDSICGWSTTYQFHDQQCSNNSTADWWMQEYTITQNGIDDKTMGKDSGALCRVFQNCPSLMQQGHALPDTLLGTPGNSTHLLNLNSITREGEASTRSYQANNIGAEPIVARDNPLNQENVPDVDWEDDYLEMDDLVIPQSPSSSSGNSSCVTVSSDERFDSLHLQDIQDLEKKGADHKFIVTSVKPDRIITCSLSPGSSTACRQEEIQTTRTTIASSPHSSATTGKTAGQTLPKQEIIEDLQNRDGIPAVRSRATSASSSDVRASTSKSTCPHKRGMKGLRGIKMRMKLCFMP